MTKEKFRYHAFIDSEYKYYTTDTPQNFSYNTRSPEFFTPLKVPTGSKRSIKKVL